MYKTAKHTRLVPKRLATRFKQTDFALPSDVDLLNCGSLFGGSSHNRHDSHSPYLLGKVGNVDLYKSLWVREHMLDAARAIEVMIVSKKKLLFVAEDADIAMLAQPFIDTIKKYDAGSQIMWSGGPVFSKNSLLTNYAQTRRNLLLKMLTFQRRGTNAHLTKQQVIDYHASIGLILDSTDGPDMVIYLGTGLVKSMLNRASFSKPTIAFVSTTQDMTIPGMLPIIGQWNLSNIGLFMQCCESWVTSSIEKRHTAATAGSSMITKMSLDFEYTAVHHKNIHNNTQY
jgi:hypothetical protein